jgi:hypothetical protein
MKLKMVTTVATLAVLLAAGVCVSVAYAGATDKPPSPPGQTSNPGSPGDDCSHGNSNQPCKPDPQPGHGSECDDHGNASGNEDHCANTTTTLPSASSSTSTSTSTSTSSTTTSTTSSTTTPTGLTTPASGTTISTGNSAGDTTASGSTTTSAVEGTSTTHPQILLPPKTTRSGVRDATLAETGTALSGQRKLKLPFTGLQDDLLALVGGLLLGAGLLLRRLG